jgi:hypothetical protein
MTASEVSRSRSQPWGRFAADAWPQKRGVLNSRAIIVETLRPAAERSALLLIVHSGVLAAFRRISETELRLSLRALRLPCRLPPP